MAAEPEIDLLEWIDEVSRRAEPVFAIVSASILEDWLGQALETQMRDLTSTLRARLFGGYGALATFSAKIDVAYAFKLFDEDLYNDFRAIKDIRNKFAHTRDLNLHFNSLELAPEVQKLTGWTNKSDPEQLFNQRVHACVKAVQPHMNQSAIVKALKKDRAPQSTHPDQSQS